MIKEFTALDFYNNPLRAHKMFNDPLVLAPHSVVALMVTFFKPCLSNRPPKPDEILLDLGCGPGATSLFFANQLGFNQILAVDGSPAMLAYASKTVAGSLLDQSLRIDFQPVDLLTAKIPSLHSTIKVALSASVLMYLEDLEHLFSELGRVLQTGGYFVFDIINSQESLDKLDRTINCPVSTYFHSHELIFKLAAVNGLSPFKTFLLNSTHCLYIMRKLK